MAKTTLTTGEVALLWGVPPGTVARLARRHGIVPLRREGRCTIWRLSDWAGAGAPDGMSPFVNKS